MTGKITLAIVIVAVLAALAYLQFMPKAVTVPNPEQKEMKKEAVVVPTEKEIGTPLPIATGNVDDAAQTFLKSADNDTAMFTDAASDAMLLKADSQAISDVGQTYDENDFK